LLAGRGAGRGLHAGDQGGEDGCQLGVAAGVDQLPDLLVLTSRGLDMPVRDRPDGADDRRDGGVPGQREPDGVERLRPHIRDRRVDNLGDLAFGPAYKPGELDLGQAQALAVVGYPLAS
jgi:hypothetical protein